MKAVKRASQLALPPMRVFARCIKLPKVPAVQRSHDADACHHGRAVMFDDQEHRFDRSRHSARCCSALGSFWIYLARVLEGDEMAAARQRDRIKSLARIAQRTFSCGPIPLMAPRLKIGLGSFRRTTWERGYPVR